MGGGYFKKLLTKDIKEINKVFLSLFCTGIIVIAIYTSINLTKSSYALFTDTIKGEKTIEVVVDTLINKTTVFNYTGTSQEYEVPKDGYYYIEMAGAEGGSAKYTTLYKGGKGAKTSGYIYLEKGEKLYFYVGGAGQSITSSTSYSDTNGYNGGGYASYYNGNSAHGGGGGATDVRLISGSWDNMSSLISRIMVAGGGGGASSHASAPSYSGKGGSGGTLYGSDGSAANNTCYNYGTGGTQMFAGEQILCSVHGTNHGSNSQDIMPEDGGFGFGSNYNKLSLNDYYTYSGSGSGYYGGGSGYHGPGAGGSSYISGYAGVNSVEEKTTITHTNNTLHYSGKYFIGGNMIEGQNEGNGYAKITYIYYKPHKNTNKLNNVRYIRNCINGSSANTSNHWTEFQTIKDGVNIAKGKSVVGTVSQKSLYPYSRITDGHVIYNQYGESIEIGNQCITVDLGDTYDLDEIAVWNYFGDTRSYHDSITSVSSNNSLWTEVINEAGIETSNGHRINAYTDTYNGYIQDDLVLWYDGYSNTGNTRNYTTTTWKDLSGNDNDVTVSGATWNYNYLSFDGVNDYAYKTSGTVYNIDKEHTIEVLLKPRKVASSYQSVFNTINSGTSVLQYGSLWISKSNEIGFNTGDGSTTYDTNRFNISADDMGKYFLMTSVRNDRNYKLYNKGKLINESEYNFDARVPNPGIFIGGMPGENYFQGEIYSIRVYNRDLTEDELLHNYNYDKEEFNIK